MSKEKICKCGHSKLDHQDKPESKLSSTGECKRCKCVEYLNRKLPDKFSVFAMVIGFFILGFYGLTSMMLYSLGSQAGWDKPITMSVGALVTITISLLGMAGLIIINSTLFDYFHEKKRREYPIE